MSMVQIFTIKDTKAFIRGPVFRKFSGHMDDAVCIALSSMDGLDNLVATGIVEAVSFGSYTEDECKEFIREYTAFIASLNSRYKERFLWWATDISSKNRYMSPLPDLLQELYEIYRGSQICSGRPILIIAPSIGIYGALRKAMAKHGRKLFWPGAEGQVFLKRTISAGEYFFRLFLYAARFYARALWSRMVLRQYARRWLSRQKEFYVIKTFSYSSSWDDKGDYTDTFFGRLPRILSKDNNVLILSYHWQGYREFIRRIFREKTLAIFPVEFFLKGNDVLRAIFRILTFRLRTPAEVYFSGVDVSDILRFELARTMNGVQIFQLLHYDAMRNMFKQLRVGTFLFTFENNPWERMCMLACRHFSPLTKVIGFQHSVVPQAALNMFISPQEHSIVPLPDRLVTSGEIPTVMLKSHGDYSGTEVVISCGFRYEYLHSAQVMERNRHGHILVVLDGCWDTRLLVAYCLAQADLMPQGQFVIRTHPALPWDLLSSHYGFSLQGHSNVAMSREGLMDDLKAAQAVVYWQSTVALEALRFGRPVINFNPGGILSFDPAKGCPYLRRQIGPQDRLQEAWQSLDAMGDKEYETQSAQARVFIERYFHPESPLAFELFVLKCTKFHGPISRETS